MHFQEILIKAFKKQDWESDLQIVIQNFGVNESDVPSLKTHLLLFPEIAKLYGLDSRIQLSEMNALFQKQGTIKRMLVAKVIKLVKLILVMWATNPVSERSFLSLQFLKGIKTSLRSATTSNRLSNLLILHIHKLLTEKLNLTKVADEFVERREGRKSRFGLWYCTALSFVGLFRRTSTFRTLLQ